MTVQQPRLYTDLAEWFHLLTPPDEYAKEAEFYRQVLVSATPDPVRTVLELGSGGGNNAWHLKAHFSLTLVDLSPQMLRISRAINPECEHILGDMRTVRLDRLFDAVFIHDAVGYMTTLPDLDLALRTAWLHCRPGGVVLLAPDFVRETFRPGTGHGGRDGQQRAMRYLEWTWDPDPSDSSYLVELAYLLRDEGGEVRLEAERHRLGLFGRAEWLDSLRRVGFEPRAIAAGYCGEEPLGSELFLGLKPVPGPGPAPASYPSSCPAFSVS